jgi:hypothetical protein
MRACSIYAPSLSERYPEEKTKSGKKPDGKGREDVFAERVSRVEVDSEGLLESEGKV